jgi:hypothetical protein
MHNQNNEGKPSKLLAPVIAGLLRGASSIIIQPIEVAKVRVQTLAPANVSSFSFLYSDLRNKGPFFFYRGLAPSLLSIISKGTYKYEFFTHGKKHLGKITGNEKFMEEHPIIGQGLLTPFIVILDTAVQGPFRIFKTVLITRSANLPMLPVVTDLIKNPKGLWRGSSAAAVKQTFGVGTTLLLDASIREEFKKRGMDTSHKNPQFLAASVASGITLALINTPLDVVSSRTSAAKPIPTIGFLPSLKYIYQTEGTKAFTRGSILRSTIYCVTTVYTSLMISWGRGREEKSPSKGRE